jgi:hypothetical protein
MVPSLYDLSGCGVEEVRIWGCCRRNSVVGLEGGRKLKVKVTGKTFLEMKVLERAYLICFLCWCLLRARS